MLHILLIGHFLSQVRNVIPPGVMRRWWRYVVRMLSRAQVVMVVVIQTVFSLSSSTRAMERWEEGIGSPEEERKGRSRQRREKEERKVVRRRRGKGEVVEGGKGRREWWSRGGEEREERMVVPRKRGKEGVAEGGWRRSVGGSRLERRKGMAAWVNRRSLFVSVFSLMCGGWRLPCGWRLKYWPASHCYTSRSCCETCAPLLPNTTLDERYK